LGTDFAGEIDLLAQHHSALRDDDQRRQIKLLPLLGRDAAEHDKPINSDHPLALGPDNHWIDLRLQHHPPIAQRQPGEPDEGVRQTGQIPLRQAAKASDDGQPS
jgi:hypothetical protein